MRRSLRPRRVPGRPAAFFSATRHQSQGSTVRVLARAQKEVGDADFGIPEWVVEDCLGPRLAAHATGVTASLVAAKLLSVHDGVWFGFLADISYLDKKPPCPAISAQEYQKYLRRPEVPDAVLGLTRDLCDSFTSRRQSPEVFSQILADCLVDHGYDHLSAHFRTPDVTHAGQKKKGSWCCRLLLGRFRHDFTIIAAKASTWFDLTQQGFTKLAEMHGLVSTPSDWGPNYDAQEALSLWEKSQADPSLLDPVKQHKRRKKKT
jgi:hypothetical protein